MNALNDGWSVKKSQDKYIFSKKHENKVEVFQEEYLATFILQNMQVQPRVWKTKGCRTFSFGTVKGKWNFLQYQQTHKYPTIVAIAHL